MTKLFIVATPLGNLQDISLRAMTTLREVDHIAAEDTRKTGRLLQLLDLPKKPQIAFHDHNENTVTPRIIELLRRGETVALVSNAGTPGISDPGYPLVQACVAAGIPVEVIPGPSALVMALVLSGLPNHSFTFRGFPPRKSGKRQRFLAEDAASPHTLIYYESPYRLKAFLADAIAVLGDRPAALANELTKLYESVERGRLSELLALFDTEDPRGEYVVVIQGKPDD